MSKLTDEEIRAKTQYFKDYLKKSVKGLEEQQMHNLQRQTKQRVKE